MKLAGEVGFGEEEPKSPAARDPLSCSNRTLATYVPLHMFCHLEPIFGAVLRRRSIEERFAEASHLVNHRREETMVREVLTE